MPAKKKKKPAARKTKKVKAKKGKTKKAAIKKVAKAAKEKHLGKVVHYYDRIGVAIIDLKSPISLGDTVLFKRGEMELIQRISSLQIDHADVQKAKKGDVVGMKTTKPVHEGAVVMPA